MASCKDCVHVEVCEDFTKAKLSPKRAEELLPVLREHGRTCDHFKDRSRFVELEKCENNEIITLEDAITHCYDIADGKTGACEDCRAEHMMLGSWLRELKLRRELELQNPPQLAELPRVGD